MNSKERSILLLLAALNFTHILDFMILMPLGNYLIPYFNISPQQFAILVSCYTISAAVSGFMAAFCPVRRANASDYYVAVFGKSGCFDGCAS